MINKKIGTIIYYGERVRAIKEVFEKIRECSSCHLTDRNFGISASTVIKEPLNSDEELFNLHQKMAFADGYNRCIYSFTI